MKPHSQSKLELTHIIPTVASDGHGVFISNEGDIPTLNFFQVRKQEGEQVYADVVASIRMNSIQDLKNLQTSIEETIRNHGAREV